MKNVASRLEVEKAKDLTGEISNPGVLVKAHWDTVLSILKEQWSVLEEVKGRYYKGPRTTPERAEELLKRVYLQLISLVKDEIPLPELRFLPFGRQLIKNVLIFSLLVSCMVGLLFCVVITAHARGFLSRGEMVFLLLSACVLLYLPFPLYRRTRINMEHNCRYLRDGDKGYVVMGDIREGMFISFCAHEMAHHFLREKEKGGGSWEEGWARWVQLKISEVLSQEYEVDALIPALTLLVGELKEALMLTKGNRPIPGWVRRVRSPFHTSSFGRWIRGEPSYSKKRLSVHALGTAAVALLVGLRGNEAFKRFLEGVEIVL
jgi:hypothetical protein